MVQNFVLVQKKIAIINRQLVSSSIIRNDYKFNLITIIV